MVKNKVIFILISIIFILLCMSTVLGTLLNRSLSSEYIKQEGSDATELFGSGDSIISSKTEFITDKININTASKDELKRLKGIGEAIAQNIIDYRDEYGNFDSIEEIINVKGIGKAKFEDIKDHITVWEQMRL